MKSGNALLFIWITVLLNSIGFGIVLPVMPELIMEITGDPIAQAARYGGWLLLVYAGMQFICSPIVGNLSDRFGRRPILLWSLIIFGLEHILMGWAPSLGWLFLGRIMAGSAATTFSVANAIIADVFEPKDRAKNFALIGAAFGGGFILGPVIGGFLGEIGPRVPFFATAALSFANALFGYLVLPETLTEERRRTFSLGRANPLGALFQMRKMPMVYGLLSAYFFYLVGFHVLPSTWAYFTIARFDWSEREIGMSLGASGVMMLIVQGYLIRVVEPKLGLKRTALMGMTLTACAFVGYAFASQAWMLYAFIVLGSAQGFVGPSIQGLLSSRISPDAQGELQGAVGSLMGLGSIIGPPMLTQTFAAFSDSVGTFFPGAAFILAAMLAFLSLSLTVRALSASPTIAPDAAE